MGWHGKINICKNKFSSIVHMMAWVILVLNMGLNHPKINSTCYNINIAPSSTTLVSLHKVDNPQTTLIRLLSLTNIYIWVVWGWVCLQFMEPQTIQYRWLFCSFIGISCPTSRLRSPYTCKILIAHQLCHACHFQDLQNAISLLGELREDLHNIINGQHHFNGRGVLKPSP